MKKQYFINAISGYFMIILEIIILTVTIYGIIAFRNPIFALLALLFIIIAVGFVIINPNESVVCILFGSYKGTVKENGFFWLNPFYTKKRISLRARNLDSKPIKVNDKIGNPIMIGIVLVWKVEDTYKAAFDVNNYEHFVDVQTEAAIRRLAGAYPYDNIEDENAKVTLRSGGDDVNKDLEYHLTRRLEIAGIKVIESRISYLAYAQEIAGAMLRRQQASAVVSARYKIVEGAVSMVEMALDQLSEKEIITMDEEKKATMVSNLMVVLCSDKDATPVLNTGSLYQ